MIVFGAKLTGDKALRRNLVAIRNLLRQPLRITRREIQTALSAEIVKAFRRRTDPQTRRRWSPLVTGQPATLIRNGRMFRVLRRPSNWRLTASNKMGFYPDRSVDYWRYHQSGTRYMPRRGFLPSAASVRRILRGVISREAVERWRGRGRELVR